jgi:hypothetical protein
LLIDWNDPEKLERQQADANAAAVSRRRGRSREARCPLRVAN